MVPSAPMTMSLEKGAAGGFQMEPAFRACPLEAGRRLHFL